MSFFRFKKRSIFLFILVCLGFCGYFFTGIFQLDKIDDRDLNYWVYGNDEIILNSSAFELKGDDDVCWFLIHSFCSTPDEMRSLAQKVNGEFNDTVFVSKLLGHGEVPSKIINLSLDDWYLQVFREFDNLSSGCNKVNVVGSSFGGALALKLAEEKKINNLFLLNAYIKPVKGWYYFSFDSNDVLGFFSPLIHYFKKLEVAKINDPVGLESHVAYYNFPLSSVFNSKDFLNGMIKNFSLIDENVLVLHSVNDEVASFFAIKNMFESVSSENKKIVVLNKSNHILLRDYDSGRVIDEIISFEKIFG